MDDAHGFMGTAEVRTTMADPLSTDEGEERSSAKQNFIGKVLFSNKDCDCELCQKGRSSANFQRDDDREVFDHIYAIQPLTQYENQQNEFALTVNNNFQSKWMVFIGHLQQIHGNLKQSGIESVEDLGDFLTDRVYEFREITWTEDEDFVYPDADYTVNYKQMFANSQNRPNEMLVPVREVTDEDELADLGANEAGGADEVEEVDL